MISATATATELQNNFLKYLNMVINGNEVIVTKDGEEIGRFIPKNTVISSITDSLTGILKGDYTLRQERSAVLKEKYEITD